MSLGMISDAYLELNLKFIHLCHDILHVQVTQQMVGIHVRERSTETLTLCLLSIVPKPGHFGCLHLALSQSTKARSNWMMVLFVMDKGWSNLDRILCSLCFEEGDAYM